MFLGIGSYPSRCGVLQALFGYSSGLQITVPFDSEHDALYLGWRKNLTGSSSTSQVTIRKNIQKSAPCLCTNMHFSEQSCLSTTPTILAAPALPHPPQTPPPLPPTTLPSLEPRALSPNHLLPTSPPPNDPPTEALPPTLQRTLRVRTHHTRQREQELQRTRSRHHMSWCSAVCVCGASPAIAAIGSTAL